MNVSLRHTAFHWDFHAATSPTRARSPYVLPSTVMSRTRCAATSRGTGVRIVRVDVLLRNVMPSQRPGCPGCPHRDAQ